MVERVYAKHDPDDLRDGIEKISEGVSQGWTSSSGGQA
jgi:hypothetical protein